jgi:LPS-assembly protein
MRHRLSLVFLPLLYAPVSFANDTAWNCEQNKDTKEWLCVGDEKPAKTSEPPAPAASLPAKKAQPVLAEPDDEFAEPSFKPAAIQPTKPSVAPVTTQARPAPAPMVPAPVKKPIEPVIAEPKTIVEPEDETTPVVAKEPVKKSPETLADVVKEVAKDDTIQSVIHTPASPFDKDKSTSVATKTSGWNCDPDSKESEWNCELVGTDPKGQARPVKKVASSESSGFSLLDPAFDTEQEQNFESLTTQLPYDPWESCGMPQKTTPNFTPKKSLRDTAPLELTSDFAEIFDNEIGHYLGNVDIKRADQHSLSHIANYDSVSKTLDLNGDVFYNEDNLALYGRSASIKLATDQSKLRNALFISSPNHLRGSSKVVYRDSKTFSRYKDITYTSCRPGNQDWALHASELKINDDLGKGAVKNAWLEFKGLPVFYAPYLSFPTDNRRETGFLPPSFHFTKQGGFGVYTPYYWNIEPNYDFTFTPRYLTKRGMLMDGNFRYLTEMTKGYAKFEYLPNDQQLHKDRYLAAVTNHTTYLPNLTSNLDLNYISDKNYFSQLGNALSLPNFNYLRSYGDVNYNIPGLSFRAFADNYQPVTSAITVLPYRRLPQVNLNLNHSFQSVPIDLTMENESVFFQHGTNVNAERLNTRPSVSFPLQTASAFATPKLSLQHTQYLLNKNALSSTNNISRTLPTFSLDTGAFFEKDLHLGSSPMLHTLEPRLFYLFTPYKNQSNIPLFDTAQYDFVFNSLFRENRFSGADRIQDANQLSVALTSRLVDSATGLEKLKVNLGDIIYFRNRDVTLNSKFGAVPYSVVEDSRVSPIILDVSSQLTDHLSVDAGTQWDPRAKQYDPHTNSYSYSNMFTRAKAGIHFVNQPNQIFNAGFLYRRNPLIANELTDGTIQRQDDIVQSDVSAFLPIYDNWSFVGRWQYSWLYNRTQEGFFGVEKENCCWRFRIIGRHYLSSLPNTSGLLAPGAFVVPEGQAQNTVFFQVELKGLMGLGERLENFFERNIYGYRKPEQ